MCYTGTAFVIHVSGVRYVYHHTRLDSEGKGKAKLAFGAEAKRPGATNKHYHHAVSVLLRSKNIIVALKNSGQTISLTGLGIHQKLNNYTTTSCMQ